MNSNVTCNGSNFDCYIWLNSGNRKRPLDQAKSQPLLNTSLAINLGNLLYTRDSVVEYTSCITNGALCSCGRECSD